MRRVALCMMAAVSLSIGSASVTATPAFANSSSRGYSIVQTTQSSDTEDFIFEVLNGLDHIFDQAELADLFALLCAGYC